MTQSQSFHSREAWKRIRGQLLGFSPGPQSLFLGNQRWCAADVCGPRRTSGIETSLCLRRTPSRPRTTEWEVLSAPPLYKWPLTSAGAAGCPGFRTPAKKQTHTIKSAHNLGTDVTSQPRAALPHHCFQLVASEKWQQGDGDHSSHSLTHCRHLLIELVESAGRQRETQTNAQLFSHMHCRPQRL